MTRRNGFLAALCVAIGTSSALYLFAQDKPGKKEAEEGERKVKESEVPAAALAALKKLAGSATITGLEEETENGEKFYEGAWAGPNGKVEGLVTAAGDLVEIEEVMTATSIPPAVLTAAKKEAGAGVELRFEKSTVTRYEAHYKKDGKKHEVVFSPTGKQIKSEED